GGGARETDLPADGFPPLTICSEPNDLCVSRFKPDEPAERFLHPADGIRRWWRQPQPRRFLPDTIGELDNHLWPRVEVTGNTSLGQPLHHPGGFDETRLDQRWCPVHLSHRSPPSFRS